MPRYRDLPFLQRMPVLVVRSFHITPNPAIRDNQPFKLPKPHLPFTLSLIIARVIRGVNTILLRYETTTDNTDLLQGRTLFARPACWFVIYHFLCIPTTGYWYLGSIVPYGYRPDPDDINCFIIDPVAASVVRRIWEMHAGGIGAPTIARTLNEEGIPNPTSYAKLTGYSWHNRPSSSLWSAGCIYSILHNETYLGTLCQGRQLTPEGQFHSKKNIPKDQWVRTVGHHPAIIDDELLRRELKARKEAGAHNLHEQKKNFPPGIFGKEVRCASCGKILTKGKTLRKTGYERTLFCPTRKKSPSHCKGAFISEKHLESAILHELKNLADRYSDDRVQIGICQDAQSADLIQEKNRLKTAVELIEKEITAYEQRSRDLYLKRATDGMSIDDFNSALSRIRNDVDKLRLKSKRASSELLHLNESIAAESIRMETVLKAADFNHLDKTKVSMLIESVYVHKRDPKSGTQAIDITWKF